MEPSCLEQRFDDAVGEVSGAAILQNMRQPEPPNVRRQGRTHKVWKDSAVPGIELRSPVDINIAVLWFRRALRICRDQDEQLLEQQFNLETRPALRRVHDANVDATFDEPLHQLRLERALGADGNLWVCFLH